MPKDEVKQNIFQEFLDRNNPISARNQTAKSTVTNNSGTTPSSSRYSTQDLIERANKRKQPNVVKVSFSLEKFVAVIYEIRQKSNKVLTYFFM